MTKLEEMKEVFLSPLALQQKNKWLAPQQQQHQILAVPLVTHQLLAFGRIVALGPVVQIWYQA